jgi:DNA-binding response OmpR family regulator
MRVLIVEDDPAIAANLYDYLEAAGYTPEHTADGVTGLHRAVSAHWSAILLDVSLPGMDGFTVCRKLREEARRDTPVLMLTAKDTLDDKLAGFSHGADDYLVKPFSLKEVGARLAALIKRHQGQVVPDALRCGDISMDPRTLEVERAGRPIRLPRKCLQLLQLLMESPGQVLRRAELETAVWGEALPDSDTLRSHVHTLRRTLTADGETNPIETVHGIGYRLAAPQAAPSDAP